MVTRKAESHSFAGEVHYDMGTGLRKKGMCGGCSSMGRSPYAFSSRGVVHDNMNKMRKKGEMVNHIRSTILIILLQSTWT